MKITANTYKGLVKWVFGQRSSGRISQATEEDFMRWGNSMLKACRGKGFSAVDIPSRFLALYRGFADSDANGVDFELPDSHQRIPRDTQMVPPQFDGPPRLEAIPGTSLSYVANCGTPIIRVDENSWYAWQYDVCFVAASVDGPWTVATSIPAVIYTIPPSFLFYYVTYVQVYGSTPDAVFVGYSTEGSPRTERSFMKNSFSTRFDQLTKGTKRDLERAERTRRTGNLPEIESAVCAAFESLRQERRYSFGDPMEKCLKQNPELRTSLNKFARIALKCQRGGTLTREDVNALEGLVHKDFSPGLAPGQPLGTMLFSEPISDVFHDVIFQYGAFYDLGVIITPSPWTMVARPTSVADAVFITPTNQGSVNIPADAALAGNHVFAASNTVAAREEISLELANDESTDVANAVLSYITKGLAKRMDWAVFQGTGANDQQNGAQLGAFVDPNIKTNYAAAGVLTIVGLSRTDFANTIATITPAALQQPCRWYINPTFLPQLLLVKDGPGNTYQLRGPSETGGEWELCGFPVTWAAQAPSAVAGGAKVLLFGEPFSYNIILRQVLEIMMADSVDGRFIRHVRALMRGWCGTADGTGLATLSLAFK